MTVDLVNNSDDRIAEVADDYHKASSYTKKLIWMTISRTWPHGDLKKFEEAQKELRKFNGSP